MYLLTFTGLDVLDATANRSVENIEGTCLDVPAHLNIQIITADVGAIEGVPQQEILGVQVRYVKLQLSWADVLFSFMRSLLYYPFASLQPNFCSEVDFLRPSLTLHADLKE